jgi:hypothetical protein
MNYRENRFNTIVHNAAGTFYIANHLINYFTNSKSTLNYTQNFILTALKNDYVISICRALGVISKTVTEPYWRCAGDSDRNALNMGYIYEQLIALLTNGANSPTFLTTNRLQLVIGPQLELGKVSQSLFEKSSLETFQAHYSRTYYVNTNIYHNIIQLSDANILQNFPSF